MSTAPSRLACALAAVLLAAGAGAAEPLLEKTDLFEGGKGGYTLYRIPGMVVTAKGTILVYCEARKNSSSDWATIDIQLRRSTDGGKTFSEAKKIAEAPGPIQRNPQALAQKLGQADDVTYNNAVAVVDQKTGAVHFLFCLEYMRCFYQRSDDDGQTWTKPVEITAAFDQFKKDYDWKVLATGPAHGIQLANGRLVVPVWLSTGTGRGAHKPSVNTVIFSDDHGKTWERGQIVGGEELGNPSETVVAQLADGRVMLNFRNESKNHRRLVSTSKDGATGWSKPAFHDQLLEPICMASLLRLDNKQLLFANPHNLEPRPGQPETPGAGRDRKNLTVKLSTDDGATWKVSKPLEPGGSGYSDLAVLPDGTILCFYERWQAGGKPYFLTLARFNREWLTERKK